MIERYRKTCRRAGFSITASMNYAKSISLIVDEEVLNMSRL